VRTADRVQQRSQAHHRDEYGDEHLRGGLSLIAHASQLAFDLSAEQCEHAQASASRGMRGGSRLTQAREMEALWIGESSSQRWGLFRSQPERR
jgi:hypothetical protein